MKKLKAILLIVKMVFESRQFIVFLCDGSNTRRIEYGLSRDGADILLIAGGMEAQNRIARQQGTVNLLRTEISAN